MSGRDYRYNGFKGHELDESCSLFTGRLPVAILSGSLDFGELWQLHPAEYHRIRISGRWVKTPRWQQAYGVDYNYTGSANHALPIPRLLDKLFMWAKESIDQRLNGLLVNWYDGSLKHYIGRHQDDTRKLLKEVPIVTISFGEERIFRMRPCGGEGFIDFPATNGCVFIMPYETNLAWKHEVPYSKKYLNRRVSVTLRGFVGER